MGTMHAMAMVPYIEERQETTEAACLSLAPVVRSAQRRGRTLHASPAAGKSPEATVSPVPCIRTSR